MESGSIVAFLHTTFFFFHFTHFIYLAHRLCRLTKFNVCKFYFHLNILLFITFINKICGWYSFASENMCFLLFQSVQRLRMCRISNEWINFHLNGMKWNPGKCLYWIYVNLRKIIAVKWYSEIKICNYFHIR